MAERCPTCGALMLAGWKPCAGRVEDAQAGALTSDGQEQAEPMCSCYSFADCEGMHAGVRCRIAESEGGIIL